MSSIKGVKDKRVKKEYLIEISIRNDWKLLLEGLQEINSNVDAIVGFVSLLGLESHGPKRTSRLGGLVICAS